jgi:hypothetical protein
MQLAVDRGRLSIDSVARIGSAAIPENDGRVGEYRRSGSCQVGEGEVDADELVRP